eukprot:6836613-Pyramimonas_sp.AAC.1
MRVALCLPPRDVSARGGLRELCGGAITYGGSPPVAPYNKDLVSWPEAGAAPVSLTAALAPEHHARLRDRLANSRRSTDDADRLRKELGLARPNSDPAFRTSSHYSGLIKQLYSRGMVRFAAASRRPPSLGVFM